MKRLILVLGSGGQLGDAMAALLSPRHEVVTRTRQELDITVPESVQTTVGSVCPDVIVNCAAYTQVDLAQQEPLAALAANAWAVRTIAAAAAEIDAALIHVSTDFVFDGEQDRPYVETDEPNPRGTYAISKLLGEWFAAETPRHYVLRVESLFGGANARSSVDRLFDALQAGRPARAFADRTVSPSYVDDVVAAAAELIAADAPSGLYHCASRGWTTWADLARELARLGGYPESLVEPVTMAAANLPTPRPQFAALSSDKLASLGIQMPTWQDALRRYVEGRREA